MSDQFAASTAAEHRVDLIVSGAVTVTQGDDGEWFICCDRCGVDPPVGLMPEMDETWRGELAALAARDLHLDRHAPLLAERTSA